MLDVQLELMTTTEAAKWFRRSDTWVRRQKDLLRFKLGCAQMLFHVVTCRAYVLGMMRGLRGDDLRKIQLDALSSCSGLRPEPTSLPLLSLHRVGPAAKSA